jgi:hypothetical protein
MNKTVASTMQCTQYASDASPENRREVVAPSRKRDG